MVNNHFVLLRFAVYPELMPGPQGMGMWKDILIGIPVHSNTYSHLSTICHMVFVYLYIYIVHMYICHSDLRKVYYI